MLSLDHVLLAAAELEAAAGWLEREHGLASVAGGRHPGWGTANRIVPLGDAYLELIAVDEDEAAQANPFGRWVAAAVSERPRLLGWAVRTDDLDGVAARLGLEPVPGERLRPDGGTLRWRLAGVAEAIREPALPFFIEWEPGSRLPGQAPVRHPGGPATIARLELTGDPGRLAAWLGSHALPIGIGSGEPSVAGLVLSGPCGERAL